MDKQATDDEANGSEKKDNLPRDEKSPGGKNIAGNKNSSDIKILANNKPGNASNPLNPGKQTNNSSDNKHLSASSKKINDKAGLISNRANNAPKLGTPNYNINRVSINNNRRSNNSRQPNISNINRLNKGADINKDGELNVGERNNGFQNYINQQILNPSSLIFNADDNRQADNYYSSEMAEIARVNAVNMTNRAVSAGTNTSKNKPAKIKEEKPAKFRPTKTPKIKGNAYFDLDWGILTGVSIPGSFAPKAQNNNFYGSLPIDLYTGAFLTGNINDKWALDFQVKLLIPNKANESYDHIYTALNDTGGIVHNTLKINESRKIYSAQVPVHLVYNISPNISLKAGPVVNIPLKYYRLSSITPASAFQDTAGYIGKLMDTLNAVKYETKLSFGVSTGLSYTYKRLRLEATYYFSPHQVRVTSPLSTYSKTGNNLQISIGFKLNKPKP